MNARIPQWPATLILAFASAALAAAAPAQGVQVLPFGGTDGRSVELYVLTGAGGLVAKVTTYGATLTELQVPDRAGRLGDVVLGFDSLGGYLGKEPFFGATVGRVGNRIANARFTLGGRTYRLAANDGPNHLHGGVRGFDKRVWDARVVSDGRGPAVEFTYMSRDGEEGYPGNCRVSVTYQLEGPALCLRYRVTTDRDTPVNVTNHSYFNLAGREGGTILSHELTLYADRYTPVGAGLIPTGEISPVAGTPMDFLRPAAIGARIAEVGDSPRGYDHNYVVNTPSAALPPPTDTAGAGPLLHVATVRDPSSGRVMDVWSTEPGVQFYSGNFLDGSITGKGGVVYRQYAALALETQHFPDSVNHPNFPSYVLKAGATYRSATLYAFSAR
jgi:aldose 1-epimerase